MHTYRTIGHQSIVLLALLGWPLCVSAQTPPDSRPPVRYYPTKVTRGTPSNYPSLPSSGAPAQPAQPTLPPPKLLPTRGTTPKQYSRPVIADSNGVRQASATEAGSPPYLNPPGRPSKREKPKLELPPVATTSPGMAPPRIHVESSSYPGTPDVAIPTLPNVPEQPSLLPIPSPTTGPMEPSGLGFSENKPTVESKPIDESQTYPARQSPHLLVEAMMPTTSGVGQNLSYELVIRNLGTTPALNVQLQDQLPASATYVASEPKSETTGQSLAWSLGAIEPNAEKRVQVTIHPTAEGELISRAQVSFSTMVDARATVTRPELKVAMNGPKSSKVGDVVPFQIQLSNVGTGAAQKVQLRAKLSSGLTHPSGQLIEADLADLAAGESKTLTLEVMAGTSGAQHCELSVAADGNPAQTSKAEVELVEAKLTVAQQGPTSCLVKSQPEYTMILTNPGTAATDMIDVTTTVPQGFELVTASNQGNFDAARNAIVWQLEPLAAGGREQLSFKLRSTTPTEGTIETVAQSGNASMSQDQGVMATTHQPPAAALVARTQTAIKSEGIPAIRFEVLDLEDPIVVGKDAIYEIRILNQGTGKLTNVQIVADFAEGTSPVAFSGPTESRVLDQTITFEPIKELSVKGEATYRVHVKGLKAGDRRFRVRLICDQIRTPVVKEENSRFYEQ